MDNSRFRGAGIVLIKKQHRDKKTINKDAARQKIDADMQEFLSKGGSINRVSSGISGEMPRKERHWKAKRR